MLKMKTQKSVRNIFMRGATFGADPETEHPNLQLRKVVLCICCIHRDNLRLYISRVLYKKKCHRKYFKITNKFSLQCSRF